MWWRWTILIICGILVFSCIIGTSVDWVQGKCGPFGPKPIDWWGCGIFTLIVLAIMYWVGKGIFR